MNTKEEHDRKNVDVVELLDLASVFYNWLIFRRNPYSGSNTNHEFFDEFSDEYDMYKYKELVSRYDKSVLIKTLFEIIGEAMDIKYDLGEEA